MIGKQMKSRNPLLIGLLTLMAWLWAMPSLSQGVAFGVKGGIDVMKMEFDDDVFDNSNRGGWFVGPTVVFSVPVPGFSIDLSALYDERTLKVEGEKLEQKSVIIPANARIGASLGFGSVYLCGGPQLAFNVGASSYRWEDVKNEVKQFSLQDTKFSVNLGVGASVGGHFEVMVNYNVPIGRTGDFTWSEVDTQLAKQTLKSAKSTANAWMLSVSYLF